MFDEASTLTAYSYSASGHSQTSLKGQIRQIFYPFLMLPSDSYMRQWIDIHRDNYPDDGWIAEMYSGPLLAADLPR